ncbi:MAG: sugar ABC transporter substrate-binding protein, partial [Gammaproteobacteria bacterium]|nr:sugar ABC transporter substrate-binding protein [Gammaproteobacteria bacterium]
EVLQRAEGFRQALDAAHARYRIVASQPGNWTADDADSACQNILAAHPRIDLFFSEADDMAVGCARAVRSAGSHARLVGIGGSRLAIVSLEAGRIDGTVCYEPRELGALAFDALYGDLTGRKPLHAAFITYATPGITRANVSACPAQW